MSLADPAGSPLGDGRFSLIADTDSDGQASGSGRAADECTTDGTGSCGFDGLEADAYVVPQTSAPLGYLPAESRSVFVSDGGAQTSSS